MYFLRNIRTFQPEACEPKVTLLLCNVTMVPKHQLQLTVSGYHNSVGTAPQMSTLTWHIFQNVNWLIFFVYLVIWHLFQVMTLYYCIIARTQINWISERKLFHCCIQTCIHTNIHINIRTSKVPKKLEKAEYLSCSDTLSLVL